MRTSARQFPGANGDAAGEVRCRGSRIVPGALALVGSAPFACGL